VYQCVYCVFVFFFFSSRRRHTRCLSDWSSDVCSSDLIHFTSDRRRMGAFANKLWVLVLAWLTAAVIIVLNVRLAGMAIADWLAAAGQCKTAVWVAVIPISAGFLLLLFWVTMEPLMSRWTRKYGRAPVSLPEPAGAEIAAPVYHRILVPLDHTVLDRLAVSHA